MPCYITGSESGDLGLALDEMRKELQHVTRLLCVACEQLHEDEMPVPLKKWWRHHQELDRLRKEREFAQKVADLEQKRALTKLTDKEKRILGLK